MKIKKFTALLFISTLLSSSIIYANSSQLKAPSEMLPSTLIHFEENGEYTVLEEGKIMPRCYKDPNPANEYTGGKEEEDAFFKKIADEAKNLPTYFWEQEYVITPGTYVQYGSDGKINKIYKNNESRSNIITDWDHYRPLQKGDRKEPGTYIDSNNSSNRITISEHSVCGTGRLSTFGSYHGDSIGDSDIPNKAGDCATKGTIDNPVNGEIIAVRNLDNDIKKYLRKNDIGKLPHAVLDIYKWSGIMFGEQWSETFTFENGRYYYSF